MSRERFRWGCTSPSNGIERERLRKMAHGTRNADFANPSREHGFMPLWLWNDDLDEDEIARQIHEFHAKGFGGFSPHARIGLSRRIGYLTDEWFRYVKIAVEDAARLGMKVVIYDEGSYPSGSAQGQVVTKNPAYAARCLIPVQMTIAGPASGFWRPNPGRALQDHLVCVVAGREVGKDILDPDSLYILSHNEDQIVRYDLPEGTWRLVSVWNVFSGGTVRGVFEEEEDGHCLAPPAADLMNPAAVDCFIRLTHDRYYRHLAEHFGKTIIAVFTDEPNALGRGWKRGLNPKPFSEGLLNELQEHWGEEVCRWLPALWLDCGPRTEAFRHTYDRAVHRRIERVFYGALNRWCDDHHVALTGHPERSNEMGVLRNFQWPGQDTVWRWVLPGETALESADSVAGKSASSAALLHGRSRVAVEAMGAYGWNLTMDEAKWLLDWCLARGINTFLLHGCYYSVRGRRAYESEPDIGVHNVWWPHFGLLADYARRMSWLLLNSDMVCEVLVLTDPDYMAWDAAKALFQSQIDFVYVDESALLAAQIEGNSVRIGGNRFRAIVCDPQRGTAGPVMSDKVRQKLTPFLAGGGLILEEWQQDSLADEIAAAIGRDVDCPDTPDLRVLHTLTDDQHFYYLVNEGEEPIASELSLSVSGSLELWDPMDGTTRPWPATAQDGRVRTTLRLERRQGVVLLVDPSGTPDPDAPRPPIPGEALLPIDGPWAVTDATGRGVDVPAPGDWSQVEGWQLFSGTLHYRTTFDLPSPSLNQDMFLDLNQVGDIAEVFVNGRRVGVRAWSPYILPLNGLGQSGANQLEIRVTNSLANRYNGVQMPSGLLGPVVVRRPASQSAGVDSGC